MDEGAVIHKQCIKYMKWANQESVPENCFEQTLIRIIYIMSLLNQAHQEPMKQVEDHILKTETQESRLQKLKDDLKNIESIMILEKIEDTAVEILIKQTAHYFKTTIDINLNFSLYRNILLSNL